jgi:protein-tyrosine phosphatase
MAEFSVLFCCMGNICRSPMAEGLFRDLAEKSGFADRIFVDSAGTHAHFLNVPPDPRAQKAMLARGIDISGKRSRRIAMSDFDRFDPILVMDGENFDALQFICRGSDRRKIAYLLDFAPQLKTRDVPDPYHGDERAFEQVSQMIEVAAAGLFAHFRERGLRA